MQQLFSILNQLLSHRKASVFVVLLAVAARIIQLIFYLDSFFDTTFQVIATQNLVNGHGISTALVRPDNLSEVIYQPLNNWPPGYSLLLSPFYMATGYQYLPACFLLDVLAATAIIFITRKILMLLDVSLAVINIFTLLTGFFIYYFYYKSPADGASIAFFLAAVYFTLSVIKSNNKWLGKSVITGFCLILCAGLKYLFFPVAFTIPVFLLLYGYKSGSTVAVNAAVLSFCIAAAGVAFIYLCQKNISGTGAYINASGRGFFPGHLLKLHPYIPAAFISTNTLNKLPENFAASILDCLRIVHIMVYPVIIFIAARILFKPGKRNISLPAAFLLLALSISLAISLVLVILSLLVDKEEISPGQWWTYVEDARYYGVADILLHLSVFLLFSHYRHKWKGISRTVLFIFPFLLLPEATRGYAFTAKRVINLGKEKYYWQQELGFQRYAAGIIQAKQDSLKVTVTVVSGSLYYANYRTSLHQQAPVLEDVASLNNPASLRSKEPVLLLAIIREDRREAFKPFISFHRTELAGQYNGFYFYSLYVTPN